MGYGVDIRIWPNAITSYSLKDKDYSPKEHIRRIQIYFDSKASYVVTGGKEAYEHFRKTVHKNKMEHNNTKDYYTHDHVNSKKA